MICCDVVSPLKNDVERRTQNVKAFEELLRAYAAVSANRIVSKEIEVVGQTLLPGDFVIMLTPLAGRDPEAYDDPQAVRLDRKPAHATLGHSLHRCLGQHLARRELQTAISYRSFGADRRAARVAARRARSPDPTRSGRFPKKIQAHAAFSYVGSEVDAGEEGVTVRMAPSMRAEWKRHKHCLIWWYWLQQENVVMLCPDIAAQARVQAARLQAAFDGSSHPKS